MVRLQMQTFLMAFMKAFFQIVFAVVMAIPFSYAWNYVVHIYFGLYLPQQFHHVPYWHFVCLLLVFTCVGEQIQKLVPTIVSIDNSRSD
jgi:hypothetical protein